MVHDRSQWDVPDYIKEMKIIAPKRVEKRGRKKVKRFPSAGERRLRTQNKRHPRQSLQWLLFGNQNVALFAIWKSKCLNFTLFYLYNYGEPLFCLCNTSMTI